MLGLKNFGEQMKKHDIEKAAKRFGVPLFSFQIEEDLINTINRINHKRLKSRD